MQERLKDFFEVYEFYLRTGQWTTTAVYGVMQEAMREIYGQKYKLKTSCSGCIIAAAREIYSKWH